MKKVKGLIIVSSFVLISLTTISAAWSTTFTVGVPRWGAWSDPSPNVKKTDSTRYALFNLETSPHWLAVYGDLLQNGKRSTLKFYELSLRQDVQLGYKSGYGAKGTYQQGRVASDDLEPDYRYVSFRFKP